MLLATLGSSLLGNIFTGSGVVRACNGVVQEDKFLILPHSLKNLKIQIYYPNGTKVIGVYSRKNVAKLLPNVAKHETYVVNFDEYKSIGAHWIGLYGNGNNVTYLTALELIQYCVDIFGLDLLILCSGAKV